MPSPAPQAAEDPYAAEVAFLAARLVSTEAQREWCEQAVAAYQTLLKAKVSDLVEPAALADAIEGFVTPSFVEGALRPLGLRIFPRVFSALRVDSRPLGHWTSAATRDRILALAARRDMLPDGLLTAIAAHGSMAAVLQEVLYDALKEFSSRMNPFTADWAIPSLFRRFGLFGITRSLDGLRAEFEARLEPEIRRFLTEFSRRGMQRMAEQIIERAGEPTNVELRRYVASWILGQRVRDLTDRVEMGTIQEAIEIVHATGSDIARDPDVRSVLRRQILEAVTRCSHQTLGEVMSGLGLDFEPNMEALARATFGPATTLIASPPVRRWFAAILRDLENNRRAPG